MISIQFLFVALLVGVSIGDPTGTIIPCKKGDNACIQSSAKSALSKFLGGFPELGVDSSDPLTLGEIVGDLSTLKYKFTNSTAVGLKNCDINNANLDLGRSKLKLDLICTDIVLRGHYVISGQLLILPVEGNGDYKIHIKKYLTGSLLNTECHMIDAHCIEVIEPNVRFTEIPYNRCAINSTVQYNEVLEKYFFPIEADLKQVQGSDGQQHLAVKNYKFTSNAQEPVTYDFKNLFNGRKDLAEQVLKFVNENWKEVAEFLQEPVTSAIMKRLFKNFNKLLKLISVDELYLDN